MIDMRQVEVKKYKKPRRKLRLNKKKILRVTILIIILLPLVFYTFRVYDKSINKTDIAEVSLEKTPCSVRGEGSILVEAISIFSLIPGDDVNTMSRIDKINGLELKILDQKNYLNDANCLHILSMIAIDKSDHINAEKFLNLLVEKIKVTSSSVYILDKEANFYTLENMKMSVEAIKFNASQIEGINSNVE